MFSEGIIDKKMFSLCLGKDGGYFKIGGFDPEKHIESVKWLKMDTMYHSNNYKFNILGVAMNGHPLGGSNKFSVGFVDSGTTFSYLPNELYDSIIYHFKHFCDTANEYDNQNT